MQVSSPMTVPLPWSLEIDLQYDLREIAYQRLLREGYTDATRKDAVYQFYNITRRRITQRPRAVHYSKEFVCPADYLSALKEFEEKVTAGRDLTPFMSDKIKLSGYDDLMLSDWGIRHFHLSRRYRKDGTVARSDYQIFAYVTDDAFYMIQIYSHKTPDLYSRQEMVRILRDNWPELLEPYHVKGVTGLSEKMDDHAYGEIRNQHMLTFVDLGPDQIYGMIGGGYMSNGFSTQALRSSDFWLMRCSSIQKIIYEDAAVVASLIASMTSIPREKVIMHFRMLWLDENETTLLEYNTRLILQVNIKEGFFRVCYPHEVFGYEPLGESWKDTRITREWIHKKFGMHIF